MVRPFQELDQLLYFIETKSRRRLQVPGFNFERLPGRLLRGGQSQTQEMIHHLLEGLSRSPHLFVQEPGHIIFKRQRSSHIMVLAFEAS